MTLAKRGRVIPKHPAVHITEPHHSTSSHTANQPNKNHEHRVRHLLYLITFLLIVLVIAVFFSFPFSYPLTSQEKPSASTIAIDTVSCTWEQDHFNICATISWTGKEVLSAKGYIPGGETLELSPVHTSSPFLYCQPVGSEEGYRVVRALLYGSSGLLTDVGQGVSCVGKTSPEVIPPQPSVSTKTYTTATGFRTFSPSITLSHGNGVFTKTFPDKVKSCTFTGTWVTDNRQKFQTHNTCGQAQGSFSGAADARTQYVVNDPDLFRWAGPSSVIFNPPAERYDDYSFWMETCDTEYYITSHKPRYGAQGTITGFGTNILSFNWDYYDDNTHPAVDFAFDLTCQLQSSST